MKKFLLIVLSLCLALGTAALWAQDQSGSSSQDQSNSSGQMSNDQMSNSSNQSSTTTSSTTSTTTTKKAAKAPLKWLKGTISQDGNSFTADKDNSNWSIKNPDAVKGHEGHHVRVQAHVYKADNAIHVMKVEMVKSKAAKSSSM